MKIIGYSWAATQPDKDSIESEEVMELITRYLKRRRWEGPIQLEDPDEAFMDFHLRPAGGSVLEKLRQKDVLVVPDQSYLFSSASQGLTFLRRMADRHIAVHCIDRGADIAQGRLFDLFVSILTPLARSETQVLREQMIERKRRERLRGRYLGGKPPIGCTVDVDGNLKVNSTKKKITRQILNLKAKRLSLRKIASEMQRRGLQISHVGVSRILKSLECPTERKMMSRGVNGGSDDAE